MKNYYQTVVNHSTNLILIKDEHGVYTFANKLMAEAFSTTVAEMLGKSDKDYVDDWLLVKQYADVDAEVIKYGKAHTIDDSYHLNKKTGKERWFKSVKSRIKNPKGEYEVLTVNIDITERVLTEKRLKRHKELLQSRNVLLEKTTYELDKFVYSASHDLRGPLTSLLGLINLMKMQNENAESTQYLDMMESSVDKLNTFTKDIMDFAINSKIRVELEEIDINQLITDRFNNLTVQGNIYDIKLIINNKGGTIRADKKRISIILNNLLSNAVKYWDLDKSEHWVTVDIYHSNLEYKIIIKDNGVGIHPTFLQKVTEMFYRANEKSDGAGIGLYIAKDTVDKLKGKLTIESNYQEYTKATVTIPTAIADYANTEILLVEDDSNHAELMMRILKKSNCNDTTLWVNNGKLALDFLLKEGEYSDLSPEAKLPELILLDLKLPKVDGMEVLNAIRHYPQLTSVPIVVITSSTNIDEEKRCLNMGVKAFLHKPPKTAQIQALLAKYCTCANN